MDYAFIKVPAAPVRRKARHQVETVSQLLFGEKIAILGKKGNLWVRVVSLHDNYEGWVTRNLIEPISKQQAKTSTAFVTSDLISRLDINEKTLNIPLGSSLPDFKDGKGSIDSFNYNFKGYYINRFAEPPGAEQLKQFTFKWLNAPYMWGGRTILGVDCSGFVQINFKMLGIDLPRDAWQQAQEGKPVKKLKDALPGDLAFFDDRDEIVHVGILLNNEQIIHASGTVKIDRIDKKGIINEEGKRTHSLMAIKRQW
jgi:cell wall-associated NlpC family hydrolase